MRIMPAGTEAAAEPLRRKPAPKSGFADLVDASQGEPGQADRAESACPTAATAPLTALPPPDPDARNSKAKRHAIALLCALSRLQAARLGVSADDARQQLAHMARASVAADDPMLDDALRAIAVRVAVEVAKAA